MHVISFKPLEIFHLWFIEYSLSDSASCSSDYANCWLFFAE